MFNRLISILLGEGMKSKIAKGILWSFFGVLISRGFQFFAYIFISRITTIYEYGEIGILKSAITTFSLFSLASFGITATRYISLYLEKDVKKTQRILSLTYSMTIIISFILLFLINFFSSNFSSIILGDEKFQPYIIVISVGIFFSALNGFQNGALAGFEKFKSISIINIVHGLLSLPVLYFCAKHYGALGFCYGISGLFFCLFITSAFFLRKALKENKMQFSYKELNKEFSILAKFSLPSFLGGFIVSPTILICNSILVKSMNGYAQMGIYDAAFNFSIIAMTFNGVIGQVLYPYAIKMFDKENKMFDFINVTIPWLVGVCFGVLLIYLPDIFSLMFGEEFHNKDMYNTVATIAIFIIFISHRQGISRNLAALNKMWYGFIDNLLWALIAISFTYYMVGEGAFGRAMAFVLAYFINSIFILPFYLKMKLFRKNYLFSTYSILIWIVITLSYFSIFLDLILVNRLLLMGLSLTVILVVSYNWYNSLKNE